MSRDLVSSAQLPVGLFDSGVGGLTVLEDVHRLMPDEDLVYLADNINAPYGDKTVQFILERALWLTEQLVAYPVKAVVVACNTATAVAVSQLRQQFSLPIIAMEPGIKPALEHSRNGVVGVLATQQTSHSAQLQRLVERFAVAQEIVVSAGTGLVELIENPPDNQHELDHLLRAILQPMLDKGIDTLVLGCSHYPLIRSAIQRIVGADVELIETGKPVARELERRLHASGLRRSSGRVGSVHVFANQDSPIIEKIVSQLTSGTGQVHSMSNLAEFSGV